MKVRELLMSFFIVRQMQENFIVKGKGFVDLEKAFDRVPRKVIRAVMCKLGVHEWLVSAVMSVRYFRSKCTR